MPQLQPSISLKILFFPSVFSPLVLRSQHLTTHVHLTPLGWIILDLVPLFNGHPPSAKGAAGMITVMSMGEHVLRRFDRRTGLRHLP